MALINFDCPECGHNLEVDERGAGFIVKCPECQSPLQVPDLPHARRIKKVLFSLALAVIVLLLFAGNIWLWVQTRQTQTELTEFEEARDVVPAAAQASLIQQTAEINLLKKQLASRQSELRDVTGAALDTMDALEATTRELGQARMRLLEQDPKEQTSLLRQHMDLVVKTSKATLVPEPIITETEPGKGILGRQIIFPVLVGLQGQPLRENAEVIAVEGDTISVKFAGGTATYRLSELHPGVAAYLPVDPLLVLPQSQWTAEARRVMQTQLAQHDEDLARKRDALEALLPPLP